MLRRKVHCPNCSARVKLRRGYGTIPAHWTVGVALAGDPARCEAWNYQPDEFRRVLAGGAMGPRRKRFEGRR